MTGPAARPLGVTDLYWRGDPAAIVAAADAATGHASFVAAIAETRPDWHDQAACAGAPLEVFFPMLGQSAAAAKRICSGCPVRSDCLEDALADPDLDHGVRGGMSGRARTAERRRRAPGRGSRFPGSGGAPQHPARTEISLSEILPGPLES